MNKEEIRTFVGQRVRAVEDPDSGKTVYEFSLKDGAHTYRLPIGSGTKMPELIASLIEEAMEKESEDRINSIFALASGQRAVAAKTGFSAKEMTAASEDVHWGAFSVPLQWMVIDMDEASEGDVSIPSTASPSDIINYCIGQIVRKK